MLLVQYYISIHRMQVKYSGKTYIVIHTFTLDYGYLLEHGYIKLINNRLRVLN